MPKCFGLWGGFYQISSVGMTLANDLQDRFSFRRSLRVLGENMAWLLESVAGRNLV